MGISIFIQSFINGGYFFLGIFTTAIRMQKSNIDMFLVLECPVPVWC